MMNEDTIKYLNEREEKIREAMNDSEPGTMEHQRLVEDWKEILLLQQKMEANEREVDRSKEKTEVENLQAKANVEKTEAEAKKAKAEGFKAKIEPWLQFGAVILGGLASAAAMAFTTERNAQLSEAMLEYEKEGIYDMPTVRSVMNGVTSSFTKGGKR